MTHIDNSNELLITRFRNGVKLVRPDCHNDSFKPEHSMATILQLPFSAFLMNQNGSLVQGNEEQAFSLGYDSLNQLVGKSVFDIADDISATKIRNNDLAIMKKKTVRLLDEEFVDSNHQLHQYLVVKYCLYDLNNHVNGIFGFSILLGKHKLASALKKLSQLGLLCDDEVSVKKSSLIRCGEVYLTRREQECIKFLVRGKTAKSIGEALHLSPRTIEDRINTLKTKFQVASKEELLDKIYQYSDE